MQRIEWTDAMDSALRDAWGRGLSTSAIAKAIAGATKNAIIGRARRIGLEKHANANGVKLRVRAEGIVRKRRARSKLQAAAPAQEKPSEPVIIGVHIMDRAKWQCAWPLWPREATSGLCCGKKAKKGSSYCDEHHERCYQKPPQRRRIFAQR